jgi:hypothetical protein
LLPGLLPKCAEWKSKQFGVRDVAHITFAKSARCQASKESRVRAKDYWSEYEESVDQEIAVSIRNAPTNEGRDQQSVGHEGVAAETDQEHSKVACGKRTRSPSWGDQRRQSQARPAQGQNQSRAEIPPQYQPTPSKRTNHPVMKQPERGRLMSQVTETPTLPPEPACRAANRVRIEALGASIQQNPSNNARFPRHQRPARRHTMWPAQRSITNSSPVSV